jgi:hypothetical protein
MKTIEERLRVLEDIEEIRQLKARYAAACDDNYNADDIAALFAEDAVWDGGALGRPTAARRSTSFSAAPPSSFPSPFTM